MRIQKLNLLLHLKGRIEHQYNPPKTLKFYNRFCVKIVLYEITLRNCVEQKVLEPLHTPPKAILHLCRRGSIYFSSVNFTKDDGFRIFANCNDTEVRNYITSSTDVLLLRLDGVGQRISTSRAEAEASDAEVLDPIAMLDSRVVNEANRSLERLSLIDQDFFVAFAKQMQVLFFGSESATTI